MSLSFLLPFFTFLLLSLPPPSSAQQQRTLSNFSSSDSPWLANQNQTLLSPNSVFAAGFRPASQNQYVFSIWYNNISDPTVVWSANRNSPVNGSAFLIITARGELRLNNSTGGNLWPSNSSANPNSTQLVLDDGGNLVYGGWSSFSTPTDTFLPNQTITDETLVSNNGKFMFKNSSLFFNNSDSYWSSSNAFQKLDPDGRVVQDNGNSILHQISVISGCED
ncbi:hypothetical protein L1049_006147 [Liquidambar formosana]|uniref:Bulb-type lectin domain-containing protein n=1 Tax=Liquidambar formosana TaxID=63359 RepID=A0AAP0RF18_LIQFO